MPYGDNSVLYYGSTQGKLFKLNDLYGTPAKTNISSTSFPTNSYVSAVSANDLDANELMVSFSNFNKKSIFHSTDAGTTWTHVGGNLEENLDGTGNGPAVYWVEIYPSNPPVYFAGTSAGLFSTSQLNGDSTIWFMEGASSIGNAVVNMVVARPFDGTVAVATHANGIYTAHLPAVPEISNVQNINQESVVRVFPNPSSNEFQFNCPEKGKKIFRIYNSNGALIWEEYILENADSWNWQPLAEGIYFYEIVVNQKQLSGKLISTK
jgi:hypothetical protein